MVALKTFIFLVKIKDFSSKPKRNLLKEIKHSDLETDGWLKVLKDSFPVLKLKFLKSEKIFVLTKMKVFMSETLDQEKFN